MNQPWSGSQVIGCGVFALPGMREPVRPSSTGGEAPNSAATWSQKFVLPADVLLIDPEESGTAS